MRPLSLRILLVFATLYALGAGAARAGDDPWRRLSVQVYGLSYHPDRQAMRRLGLDNEVNFGLGLNYTLHEDERGVRFLEAGLFRDSGRQAAAIAGLGYQFKYGTHWRLGGALVGVLGKTYNEGRFFIAPLPIASYDFGPFTLNATYVPRFREINQLAVFGLYLSLPLSP
jgi:hypothetical protein